MSIVAVQYANSTFLPTLAENLLASFLAALGGPLPAIAYRGLLMAHEWFWPILPDLHWAYKGLMGTIVPIMGLMVAQRLYVLQGEPG
ncbi:MAG: hypothetical protein ABIA59_10830, partial [Candidatus Latescibacterota bacterium]